MSNQNSDFYDSIVEASNRGELWGIETSSPSSSQLEIIFNINT
tara:strand:+ start:1649 stop:1777 length:129 start_codon:yes stop_codon:yes gene_type:complete